MDQVQGGTIVGLFSKLGSLCYRFPESGKETAIVHDPRDDRPAPPTYTLRKYRQRRSARRCAIEALEPRQMMAGDVAPNVVLGSVYFEEATGDDSAGDIIEVSFVGGAAGTTLNRLVIDGDKQKNGFSEGDVFFDTAAGGLGAFHYNGLSITNADGFEVTGVTVIDGGSQIVFTFSGFDAGEKLVFSIDADEVQFLEPGAIGAGGIDPTKVDTNPLVEGAEFQRSEIRGEFTAPGYVDLSLTGTYWDAFDGRFQEARDEAGQIPNLHNDRYSTTHDFSDRTAGAIAHAAQIPLATLAGWVYHDRSDDGVFNSGTEEGIGGVTLELLDSNGNPTGITTTTSTEPATLGYYEFLNLTPGKYGVREVQPTGWLDGKDTPGSHGGEADSEANGRADRIFGVILAYGDDAVNYNFGELLPGSIHGRVIAGSSPDCKFDDPEILVEGVRIDLLDAEGNVIAHTLTDSKGEYHFTGLAPGVYTVREHQPTQYYDGGERVGTAGGTSSDVPGVFSIIAGINITSDLDAFQYDFCEKVGVTLSGNVYHDRDNDGVFDRGPEEGIGGVVVKLLDASGNDTGLRATTDSAGFYEFTNLAAGTYAIMEVHPSGWFDGKDTPGNLGGVAEASPPGDMISLITINWGQTGIEYNFGELLPASIGGRVSAHSGPDCKFDDPELVLEGVMIELLDADGNLLATTKTDAIGEYRFDGLRPGVYAVREIQPTGYFDGGERVGTAGGVEEDDFIHSIDLTSGFDAVKYDFCEQLPSSIRGRVHADLDEDGDFDNPDLVLEGVVIELRSSDGTLLATTTTDANGEYLFDELAPGEYRVHEIQPTGYYDGADRVGSVGGHLDGVDSIFGIVLVAGTHAIEYDFSEHVGVGLSGNVYHDRDNDGIFDRATEEGIAGVVVKLLDANGNDTGRRATTNSTGFYEFKDLAAGTYSVMEVHPSGWLDGKDTPGNLGGVADTAIGADMISQITIGWGQSGTEYNFGELLPGSIRGQVFLCVDPGNPTNTPIPNVRIDLLDASGAVVAHTFTDTSGNYEFTGLRPGSYAVREHQPIEYFDNKAHLGSGGGVIMSSNQMTDIAIGSGIHLVDYDFCELPPSQLSGYVFVDGPPIVTNDPLTPQQIAAVRDGIRTPDDRPLANVLLELRDSMTGEPITKAMTLPGSYGGDPNEPLRAWTDANGYYRFVGLRGGTYAVVQIQPEDVIDHIDTPGTTGGIAINPGPEETGALSQLSDIPIEHHEVVERFRNQYGYNAIVLIVLPSGVHSQHNNFSEVVTQPEPVLLPPDLAPPPEPPEPVFAPLVLPYLPKLVLAPALPPYRLPNGFGGSSALGFTWHLSVVNGGQPRAVGEASAFQFTASQESVGWHDTPLAHAQWTLAVVDYNEPEIVRDEVFGHPEGRPVVGDFNGDGVSDIGVFVNGHWYIDINGNGRWDDGDLWAKLGSGEDRPVTGDWDADGKADIGIYGPAWERDPIAVEYEPGLPDPDNFPTNPVGKRKNVPPPVEEATSGGRVMKLTSRAKMRADLIDHVFHYGNIGDAPVSGDWNGDGIRQIGVFCAGLWVLDLDGDGRFTERDAIVEFGQAGDVPIVGDWNGDGVDELGVFRRGKWLLDINGDRVLDAHDKVFEFGSAGDIPVAGDWNDDGIDDPGIYRPGEIVDRVSRKAG